MLSPADPVDVYFDDNGISLVVGNDDTHGAVITDSDGWVYPASSSFGSPASTRAPISACFPVSLTRVTGDFIPTSSGCVAEPGVAVKAAAAPFGASMPARIGTVLPTTVHLAGPAGTRFVKVRACALRRVSNSREYSPPNQAYRARSHFLAIRQGKKELVDYVQELRTLNAGMAVDPLPEAVTVTVFMEGLRTGVARTEVFRTHPASFEDAVNVALNAEFNFKSSRLGWNAAYANPSSGPEPMDLSDAEDEEAELLAAEQRAGRPTGEELSSVEPHGGGGLQGLAPKRSVLSNTERVCKPGLLVVQATVNGFEKPWAVLVDSGASANYAWRSTMEGSQLYAEALKARNRDIVTVRLAMGTHVTVPKVLVDLGVRFLDFDIVECYLVLDLYARYDLILGMAWLERHEPWSDWRSKTLGASHFSPSGALASHEPTSARKQKRFWCEHETETVNVLNIGMSEMMDTKSVVDKSPEQSSWAERGAAHNPLSNARGKAASLRADGGMDRSPKRNSWTERGVARNPLSDARGEAASLHAHEGMVGSEPRHRVCGPNDACDGSRTHRSGKEA
ncbi:unnamed protein product [Phytophthora fragariaefolia]|uniref:Unnamed protein product n=1 Tax=Phytophthora fragariaefolia TaxID=1490495 RepID=A0A9W6WUH1_9STRA|nr:unnamed protein product [Phytophthora fragariaefolia]